MRTPDRHQQTRRSRRAKDRAPQPGGSCLRSAEGFTQEDPSAWHTHTGRAEQTENTLSPGRKRHLTKLNAPSWWDAQWSGNAGHPLHTLRASVTRPQGASHPTVRDWELSPGATDKAEAPTLTTSVQNSTGGPGQGDSAGRHKRHPSRKGRKLSVCRWHDLICRKLQNPHTHTHTNCQNQ